jgi:hypothetical protein
VVGGCDSSISVVDDLIAILKVSDHLSLSGHNSHLFTLVNIHAILINDGLFLGKLLILHDGLLHVSIWENLDNESIWEGEGHACSLVWIVIRI